MEESESASGFAEAAGEAPLGARPDPSAGGPAASARRSTLRVLWDGLNEVVKSPVFVFLVGGSFIALLPRLEEWRLPEAERKARAQEQQARADAALVAPFLGNLNTDEQGKFRASAAALKTLEEASRRANDGHASPMFEGVNAAVEAVARQLWPPPPTPTAPVKVEPVTPDIQSSRYGASAAAATAPPANLAQACVYIQVARDDAGQRKLATELKAELDARSILAPGIQLMSASVIPNHTQVRYFNDDDRGSAIALAAVVQGFTHTGPDLAHPKLPAKPGTLEVWFGHE